MRRAPPLITLPGYLGSPPTHWQSLWEVEDPTITRFQPTSVTEPDRDDWVAALASAIDAAPAPPLLIAHSLACLIIPFTPRPIAGAFIVAPPDPDDPHFPAPATTFKDVPQTPLPFPAVVVASINDPYGSLEHAERRARDWGAGFLSVGSEGHINAQSGLGDWPEGKNLLKAFAAGLGQPLPA
ncbi:MAG: alpha/beta fold hydrolase [Pseudomonadota bacterium]